MESRSPFRFKDFPVYKDAKGFCGFGHQLLKEEVQRQNRELASQIERALISIVLNIAEGSADHSDVEFARFLGISLRSVYETVAGFDLAALYGIISQEQNEVIEAKAHELARQLAAFCNTLKREA
jgi:four helix bundle protein